MKQVNYDDVAPEYDRRYESNSYDGIHDCLHGFLTGGSRWILEVGCGTGHWLADIGHGEAGHFDAPVAFLSECRRVLRPGGGLLTIGLDPHRGDDQWWVYDYFPSALDADLLRYPSAQTIHGWAAAAGFREFETSVAQHIPAAVPFAAALSQGLLDRVATSQLMVISDAAYEAGRSRLFAEMPVLRASLRLYASIAWV